MAVMMSHPEGDVGNLTTCNGPGSSDSRPQWYAVRVRSCAELSVSEGLRCKEYDTFLPTYKSRRVYSDRTKTVEVALFPGYVFCRMNPERRLPVLMTGGVVGIVSFGSKPAAIPDAEIESLRRVVESYNRLHRSPYIATGKRVEVVGGPLAGVIGVMVQQKSSGRLVISVDILQRSVAVEVDTSMVRPIGNSGVTTRIVA